MEKVNRPINNLKYIREIFSATQEEVADLLNVSRVSISNWENNAGGRMSRVNQEKLSNLYGIGPEYFYDREIDAEAKMAIINARNRVVYDDDDIEGQNEGRLQNLFRVYSFKDAVENYMYAMKLVIALADTCSIQELELATKINDQMTKRLSNTFESRKQDLERGDEVQTLFKKLSINDL